MCGLILLQKRLERMADDGDGVEPKPPRLGQGRGHHGSSHVSLQSCPQGQPSLVLEVSPLTQPGLIMNPHPSAAVMGRGVVE